MSAADLAAPIRSAIIANSAITSFLSAYKSSFPVFTRRPAPTDVDYPIIMVSPDVSISDQDGLTDYRPIQQRDVTVYGQNNTNQKYRAVEALAYHIRQMFHSQWQAITVPDWKVVDINCLGPIPAPTDDDKTIARVVSLTIQLAKLG